MVGAGRVTLMTFRSDQEVERPSEKIRKAFLMELEQLGLRPTKVKGTEIYTVNGNFNGIIYLKIRSKGKAFFGLRCDFLKILLGEKSGILSDTERQYLTFLLSDDSTEGLQPPNGWKLKSTILRRLVLAAKHRQPWTCALLLGRSDRWMIDGWSLTSTNVAAGIRHWSFPRRKASSRSMNPIFGR